MGSPRPLSKKQVQDMLARGDSLFDLDMRGVDLSGVCFDNADLEQAKLAEANLSRATFRNATLKQASLWHANLTDAVFDGANMEEADLDFADLDGATFKGAKVKKAIFPFNRVSLDQINTSVRTGRRVRMDARRADD